MEPEVVKAYRVYCINNEGNKGIYMPTKAMAEEILSLLKSHKDGVITFPGYTCKLYYATSYAYATIQENIIEAELYCVNDTNIFDVLEEYGTVDPTESNPIEFSRVKHVCGVSFYLNDDEFLDIANDSVTDGPGMTTYKLEMNDFIEQANHCLSKFGYKIIKE